MDQISDDTVTSADLAKALAPVVIGLGIKLGLMYAIRRAARNAIKNLPTEEKERLGLN